MNELRTYRNPDFVYSDDSNSPPDKKYGKDLAAELGKMFETGVDSDFIVFVRGREIRVHKFILRSRSPVFNKMLTTEMIENIENRLVIDDFEYDVMHDLFHYLYDCTAPNIDLMTVELLEAADRYGVINLRNKCEKRLEQKINASTACVIYGLANRYDLKKLRELSTNFLIEYGLDVPTANYDFLPSSALRDLFLEVIKRISPTKRRRLEQ